jgi:ubiquinol-cytochrome c reductase cytochrome b subunit
MSSHVGKPTWTARVREAGVAALPPEKLLADRQPVYVATWIYVFGVLSLSAFLVIPSRAVIALAGPAWWHTSSVATSEQHALVEHLGLFFSSWSFTCGGSSLCRPARPAGAHVITGAIAFLVSIATAFTGYLSQQNLDSQDRRPKDGSTRLGSGRSSSSTSGRCCGTSSAPLAVAFLIVGPYPPRSAGVGCAAVAGQG